MRTRRLWNAIRWGSGWHERQRQLDEQRRQRELMRRREDELRRLEDEARRRGRH